jgi:hypothetical protein
MKPLAHAIVSVAPSDVPDITIVPHVVLTLTGQDGSGKRHIYSAKAVHQRDGRFYLMQSRKDVLTRTNDNPVILVAVVISTFKTVSVDPRCHQYYQDAVNSVDNSEYYVKIADVLRAWVLDCHRDTIERVYDE